MLIDRFNSDDRAAFLAASCAMSFSQGEVLYEADAPVAHVLFVESGIISAVVIMEDGRSVET